MLYDVVAHYLVGLHRQRSGRFFLEQKGFSLDKEIEYNPFYSKHPRRKRNKQTQPKGPI
jgi:hypothetical protein